jgi:hypothetical protein
MRTCSPSEFLSRWPGSLHPAVFPDPSPALPEDCQQLLTKFGLPRELTIFCYNDITVPFSESATPLAVIWERDLKRGYKIGDMPGEWTRFWHLADQEYTQRGGWKCVEYATVGMRSGQPNNQPLLWTGLRRVQLGYTPTPVRASRCRSTGRRP